MATTSGDIAAPQKRLGEKNDDRGINNYVEVIRRANAEKLKRYFDLVGRPMEKSYSKKNTSKDKK